MEPERPDYVYCPECDETPWDYEIYNLTTENQPEVTVWCENHRCSIIEVSYLVDHF